MNLEILLKENNYKNILKLTVNLIQQVENELIIQIYIKIMQLNSVLNIY